MLFKRIYDIFKCAIVGVCDLFSDNLPKFFLECFCTSFLHLRFGKCFLVADGIQIPIIEVIPDRIC